MITNNDHEKLRRDLEKAREERRKAEFKVSSSGGSVQVNGTWYTSYRDAGRKVRGEYK